VTNLVDLDRFFAQIEQGKLDVVFDSLFNANVKGLLFYGPEGATVDAGMVRRSFSMRPSTPVKGFLSGVSAAPPKPPYLRSREPGQWT
jgi:hypothetical protein